MRTTFRHILKTIFVYISLSIMLILIVNSSLYTHSHISKDGQVIVHAHPFSDSEDIPLPLNKTNHSDNSIYILSSITILFLLASIIVKFEILEVKTSSIVEKTKEYFCDSTNTLRQRGPPFCC